ncbi:hypothetical protein KKD52_07440 [Myxococcota bacterium]|nr:hypothetical protein [Myxococcota bacterium]MBU1412769.1 hypothetical protein [Myxococcota bacterium]MBU1510180.1 hypothetical protein [Myxococcota bacterium]
MKKLLLVVVLLMGCRNRTVEPRTPSPRMPQEGVIPVGLQVLEKPGFFFVHRVGDTLLLGLTHQSPDGEPGEAPDVKPRWTFAAQDLSDPEVLSSSYFIAVTRKIRQLPEDLAAFQGRRVAVYGGTKRICETTVRRVLTLNQFHVREPVDYGMPPYEVSAKPGVRIQDLKFTPKYDEIFRESTFSVAAELEPCPGFSAPAGASLWARPAGMDVPSFLPDDPSGDLQARVSGWLEKQEAWQEIKDFKAAGSSEKPQVVIKARRAGSDAVVVELTATIGDPGCGESGIRHFFVLQWNGKDLTKLYQSRHEDPLTFVADLDGDGQLEVLQSRGSWIKDRRMFRIGNAAWSLLESTAIVDLAAECE